MLRNILGAISKFCNLFTQKNASLFCFFLLSRCWIDTSMWKNKELMHDVIKNVAKNFLFLYFHLKGTVYIYKVSLFILRRPCKVSVLLSWIVGLTIVSNTTESFLLKALKSFIEKNLRIIKKKSLFTFVGCLLLLANVCCFTSGINESMEKKERKNQIWHICFSSGSFSFFIRSFTHVKVET